jgi:hypothetical protein
MEIEKQADVEAGEMDLATPGLADDLLFAVAGPLSIYN